MRILNPTHQMMNRYVNVIHLHTFGIFICLILQPIELARPKPSKQKEKKKKKTPVSQSLPTPPDRVVDISGKLRLVSSSIDNPILSTSLLDETAAAEEELEDSQSNETLLPPSVEELTFNDNDKTLNDLLTSLHSTKVRRMHKYTDQQLAIMHKHNEFNRMLQSYVDVSIHNGKVCSVSFSSLIKLISFVLVG